MTTIRTTVKLNSRHPTAVGVATDIISILGVPSVSIDFSKCNRKLVRGFIKASTSCGRVHKNRFVNTSGYICSALEHGQIDLTLTLSDDDDDDRGSPDDSSISWETDFSTEESRLNALERKSVILATELSVNGLSRAGFPDSWQGTRIGSVFIRYKKLENKFFKVFVPKVDVVVSLDLKTTDSGTETHASITRCSADLFHSSIKAYHSAVAALFKASPNK